MIRVDIDTRRLEAELRRLGRAVPAAAARALNATARAVQKAEKAEIVRAFPTVTPFMKNSPRVRYAKATITPIQAAVVISGRAAGSFEAEIRGGRRDIKPFEQTMRAAGVLPQGRFVVPGRGAKLDRYGNIDGDQLAAILHSLGALSQRSQNKRRGRKRTRAFNKASSYFVRRQGNSGQAFALFAKKGKKGKASVPVMFFVSHANYSSRFDFFGKGVAEIRRVLPIELDRQMQRLRRSP